MNASFMFPRKRACARAQCEFAGCGCLCYEKSCAPRRGVFLCAVCGHAPLWHACVRDTGATAFSDAFESPRQAARRPRYVHEPRFQPPFQPRLQSCLQPCLLPTYPVAECYLTPSYCAQLPRVPPLPGPLPGLW